MRKPSFAVAMLHITAGALTITATAADLSYTPQGDAPYYWSNTAAWGGALPGADDSATLSNAGLLTHPLILEATTSASVATCFVNNAILYIEPGGSLNVSVPERFSLARTSGSTGVVTNYGTISTVSLDLGTYPGVGGAKGALARFDNFDTLNISTHFRMGVNGTPSVFYNHEGATFNKTGGGGYSFYLATHSGGDSTIINEGTMVCGPKTQTWSGNNPNTKSEIIMRKSGTFDPGPTFKIGHGGNSVTTINLYDKSRLSGATTYTVGGAAGCKGYITLSNESAFVAKAMDLGYSARSLGVLSFTDDATATFSGNCNIGGGATSTGIVEFADSSIGTFANCYIGLGGSKSFGSLTFAGDSSATFGGQCGVGSSVGGVGEMHLKDSALVTTRNQLYACVNAKGCSTGLVTLADSSIISNVAGALVIGCYSNAFGRMELRDNSRLVNLSTFYVGHGNDSSSEGAHGELSLHGNASVEAAGSYLYLGSKPGATGVIDMHDSSALTVSNYIAIGREQYATGLVTVAGNASIDAGLIHVASAWLSRGALTVTNNAAVTCTNMIVCARNTSDGDLYISGGSVTCTNLSVAAFGTSDGCVVVADEGRLICSNITMATADKAVANMTVTNGGFVQCSDIQLATGTKGSAHMKVTDGAFVECLDIQLGIGGSSLAHLKVEDDSVLVASNLTLAVDTTASTGILEIAEGGIVSNDYIKIGCHSDSARGILKMSGGSLIISGKDPRDPIYLNQRLGRVSAWIRGWGRVAFEDPRATVTEWSGSGRTRCIVHYGQVIADGEGEERDLDFSRFNAISYANTAANTSGTNGWFAVNKGRLKLPRCLPRKTANYRCTGDCCDLNYANETSNASTSNRLANTFTTVFTGAALNNYVFSELYATDRSDIPAGLPTAAGAGSPISVWRIGLFTDGPEIDEPVSPSTFTSAKIHFRMPNDGFDDLALLCVYRHDGTAGGQWRLVGHTRARKGWPVVPASVSSPSAANWNMGWFAVVGREKPFGTALLIR